MADPILLLANEDGKTVQSAIEKRLRANHLADAIFRRPAGTPARWRAIRAVWYGVDPNARQDHRDAVVAAKQARDTMDDPKYGLTKASRGLAKGEEVNGNVNNSLVAIMPETLKAWLVRFDPQALSKGVNKGAKEQRKIWRKVYACFPEYRTTTDFKGDY